MLCIMLLDVVHEYLRDMGVSTMRNTPTTLVHLPLHIVHILVVLIKLSSQELQKNEIYLSWDLGPILLVIDLSLLEGQKHLL